MLVSVTSTTALSLPLASSGKVTFLSLCLLIYKLLLIFLPRSRVLYILNETLSHGSALEM